MHAQVLIFNFGFEYSMFACITPCIAFGSAAERTTLSAYILFLFAWSTLVFDFISYWTCNPNGWMHKMGILDFASATPVHVASGFSSLA
jgi:Amt family ammonium transporter